MPINIHGNEYVTVAERIRAFHDDEHNKKGITISTEVLFQNPVVIKATVITAKGTFTGISAANPLKPIEKVSPYEVAESSAVGRALGFAGYGLTSGIASAEEITKTAYEEKVETTDLCCDYHKSKMALNKNGKPYHRDGNRPEGSQFCNGRGFPDEKTAWTKESNASSKSMEDEYLDALTK